LGAHQSSKLLLALRISVNTPGKRASVMPKLPATAAAEGKSGPRNSAAISRSRCLRDRSLLLSSAPTTTFPLPRPFSKLDSSSSTAATESSVSETTGSAAAAVGVASAFICMFCERCLSAAVPQWARYTCPYGCRLQKGMGSDRRAVTRGVACQWGVCQWRVRPEQEPRHDATDDDERGQPNKYEESAALTLRRHKLQEKDEPWAAH